MKATAKLLASKLNTGVPFAHGQDNQVSKHGTK